MNLGKNRTAIIAIGDTNLRDAGVGQFLLQLIEELELPDGVDIYDCGISAECFDGDIRNYNRVVLLTAHAHGEAAGEILCTTIASDIHNLLKGLPLPLQRTRDQLIRLFESTSSSGDVEWILIGIEPKSISPGVSLSDDVIKAAPKALNFISDLLWQAEHNQSLS